MAVGNMFRQRRDLSGRRRNPGALPMFQTNQYAQSPLSAAPAQSAGGLSRSPALAALNPLTGGLQGMMMQGLGRAQSLTGRQQSPPTSGMYADGVMDREFGRSVDMGNARMAPMFGSAGQAGAASRSYPNVMGQSMANAVNGYVGTNPITMTPQDKFNTAQAAAQRYMGGSPSADPTGLGRRFGAGSPLVSGPPQVTDAQRQQASQDMLRGLNPKSPFDRAQKVFGRQQADGSMAYTDRLTAMQDYVDANPMDVAARDALATERDNRELKAQQAEARRGQFKAENGGRNFRQVQRDDKAAAREQKKFNQAVMQGLNPMSPQAQALFPTQAAATRAGMSGQSQTGVSASEQFMPGGRVTAESREKAKAFRKNLFAGGTDAAGNPTPPPAYFAGMGLTGDETDVQSLHNGIMGQLEAGIEPTDEELKMIHGAIKAMEAEAGPGNDPFVSRNAFGLPGDFLTGATDFNTRFSEKYKSLAGMENPGVEDLRVWWGDLTGQPVPMPTIQARPDNSTPLVQPPVTPGRTPPVKTPNPMAPRQKRSNWMGFPGTYLFGN